MGIGVVWDDEQQSIIRWDFEANWDWSEFREAFEISLEMASGVEYRIDIIPYTANTEYMPPGALSQFKRISDNVPDNTHLIVITGGDILANVMIQTFAKIWRASTWRTARTLEEARDIITQDRS